MKLPETLLDSLKGIPGFNKQAFQQVHEGGEQVVSIRFNPQKNTEPNHPLIAERVPWSSNGYYLKERPFFTFDPLLHAGVYYVQEASSMFLEQAIKQTSDLSKALNVLDLCAAPGGKSTLIQSIISPDALLVSNEVIKSRVNVLEENLTKWGALNVVVTNNNSQDFRKLENFFDVIVVDAPCSGSGLFRKDPDAIDEWSMQNVMLCAQRQQRILADVYPALKQNGILIYSTCSYSYEENEEITDWLMDQFSLGTIQLKYSVEWGIVETISPGNKSYGYRFFPDKIKGEGFFLTCLKKMDGSEKSSCSVDKKRRIEKISKTEQSLINTYITNTLELLVFKLGSRILAFPQHLQAELLALMSNLYIRKAGVAIGKPAANELIPDHELAMSKLADKKIVEISLKKEDALQYLRREEVTVISDYKGWAIVEYEGNRLGWIKILQNRSNNYYPKEWRILKSATN